MEPKRRSYLRDIRLKNSLSTKELGRKLEMDPSAITRIEYRQEPCGEVRARRFGTFFSQDWVKFLSEKENGKNETKS